MRKIWIFIAVAIFGCSKAELPNTPRQITILEVNAVDSTGVKLDSTQVFLDGIEVGTTPYKKEGISSGLHSLRLSKENYQLYTEQLLIVDGRVHSVEAVLTLLPARKPQLEFSVIEDSIVFGEAAQIEWSSNANRVVIDQSVGERGPVGTEEVSFSNPGVKIFTATAYGSNNAITIKNDSVIVKEAPLPSTPVVMLSTTRLVQVNTAATISWQSQNADYLVVDFVDNPDLNGSVQRTFSSPGIRIVTATAFNQSGYMSTTDTIEVVVPHVDPVDDIILFTPAQVIASEGESGFADLNAATFDVETAGTYRVLAQVWYNSGDNQLNESFYLEIRDDSGQLKLPQDPNAGQRKVVPDDPGEPHTASRPSGEFDLASGTHSIDVYHYAKIAPSYPQFLNGNLNGPESVKILGFKLVYVGN